MAKNYQIHTIGVQKRKSIGENIKKIEHLTKITQCDILNSGAKLNEKRNPKKESGRAEAEYGRRFGKTVKWNFA